MIVGQNSLLNQYVPTFYIKNLADGQGLLYDAVRKAFVNADISGGGSGSINKLGELLNVSPTVDSPNPSLHNGQALTYNAFTSLWENTYVDYNTLLNKPTSSSFSFAGLSDTAKPSLPDGYVKWNSTGTQLVYSTTIPAASITGLATVATTGNYNDLINKPSTLGTVTSVNVTGGTTGLTTTGGPVTSSGTITLTGTLSIANGGTGQTTASAAINALLPTQTGNSGKFLTTDGSTTNWAAMTGTGTVTSVSATGTQGVTTLVINGSTTPSITIGLGAITPTSIAASGTVSGSNLSGTNTGDQTITLTGDVSGSGTASFPTTLATVNATTGTFGNATSVPQFIVDAKGRITNVINVPIVSGGTGTVTSVSGTGTVSGLTLSGTVTSSGNLTLGGALTLTSGQVTTALGYTPYNATNPAGYTSNTGTVTSISGTGTVSGLTLTGNVTNAGNLTLGGTLTLTSGQITTALGFTPGQGTVTSVGATGTSDITVTGSPITTTGSFAISLANTAVTPNTYGSSTFVPVFTVDSKGRITNVTNTAISGGNGTVTSVTVNGTAGRITSTGSPIVSAGAINLDLAVTSVVPSTYGSSTSVPVFSVDAYGRVTGVTNTPISGGSGSASTETVVFHYTPGGSGNFNAGDAIFSQSAGVTTTITDAANCVATYSFTGKTNPPKSVTMYGQNYTTNKFAVTSWPATAAPAANYTIAGGGTSLSPDLANGVFSAANIVTMQTRMSDTGAASTIGNRAWLIVVFGF